MIAQLEALLTVEELDRDLYRGARQPEGRGRVFGGQVIAQALMAAARSADPDRLPHSLHAYFMRAGDEQIPIIYRVNRDHDGGSFSTRRAVAFQRGEPILNMAASFQRLEQGLAHQFPMPDVPGPEDLPSEAEERLKIADQVPEAFREFFVRPRPFEIRHASPWSPLEGEPYEPVQHVWFKAVAPVAGGLAMHRAMLAWASDMHLLGTTMRPHGLSWTQPGVQTASLDHALWFHDDVRVDEWLLYSTDAPWSGRGRGFNRGMIFTRDGRLVASVAQEGLMRKR
ncbi:acyl-CoA thioesterase II [Sphingomonas sp. MAH-20]|uniref:Acyl-CoA thioesterase 2 n=1 Tax=Sphingomonas horti TaxID=2682842 RepID=A0A6I4IZP9_9SPHN|nr:MULTISPECIES: acyl-CoA thioesterase II [Sphingomonas]MBA2920711.1 acyl-CoA thioesterase II [Sphingomonas sp. CGMCC 1.13658]MVO77647.1 acyl-CoA thioesterase II [Sphingomonas horti]